MLVKDISIINPKNSYKNLSYINYIDTSSVIDGTLNEVQLLTGDYPSRAKRELHVNDIIISSVRPNLKHNYFVHCNYENLIGSTGFIQVRVTSKHIHPKFLYYFLTNDKQVKQYISVAETSQTTFPSFNKDVIENIEFPNISYEEQVHIVNTIGTIDDLIEKLTILNEKIDNFLLKFINIRLQNCTKILKVSDCSIVQNGYAFKPEQYVVEEKENTLEVLKMGHINISGGLKIEPKKDFVVNKNKYSKWILNRHDIVLGMTDMKDKVVILGVPALIDKSKKYVLNQRVARVVIDYTIVNPIIAYYQMREQKFINELRKFANSGVQVNLTTDSIKNMGLKIPDEQLRTEIENIILPLHELIEINNDKIKALKQSKNILLNKYFK